MLVTKVNFDKACAEIETHKVRSFDSETFSLFWWKSPWLKAAGITPGCFSFQISTPEKDYYFDFLHSADRLGDSHFRLFNDRLTQDPSVLWYIQNAKFDLHQSKNHGVTFEGMIHCTEAAARIMNNVEPKCSLDELSNVYFKQGKVDIKPLFKEPGMTIMVPKPGRKGDTYAQLCFDKLPLATSYEYGCKDTRLCFNLGELQVKTITKITLDLRQKGIQSMAGYDLVDLMLEERKLTKALFHMEQRGVQLDLDYVRQGLEFDYKKSDEQRAQLDEIARKALSPDVTIDWDSPKQLKPLFDALGEPYSYTDKGNASFDKQALEGSDSELAKLIMSYRFHSKRASTYWENFLWLADEDGVLHANFQQGGPETGRMSCREPNLQNLPKRRDKDQAEFKVRRAFKPRPGFVFFDADWDQMEYRMMLCYSAEMSLIKRIIDEGLDVHDAVDQEMQIGDREAAKTVNFQTLYGGGVPKLALALYGPKLPEQTLKDVYHLMTWKKFSAQDIRDNIGQTFVLDKGKWRKTYVLNFKLEDFEHDLPLLAKAEALRDRYFEKLPLTSDWIERVKEVAKTRGFILNWAGRFMNYDRDTYYKAPNGLIQGGCGDVSKKALVKIDEMLSPTTSGLCAQVHDEFLIELADFDNGFKEMASEKIVKTMESIFPSDLLKLTAGGAWSRKSWGDLQDTLD